MPLAPTVLGINLWLLLQVVPLWLAHGMAPKWLIGYAPLPLIVLFVGLRLRRHIVGQVSLLIGFPLLLTLMDALGPIGQERLLPQPAVLLKLLVFALYLATTCRQITQDCSESVQRFSVASWTVKPLEVPRPSMKQRRRALTHHILLAYCVAMPTLLLYAICLHGPNIRQFVRLLGTMPKVTALQAALLSASTMLWASLFYFGVMRPLKLHISHDPTLRHDVSKLRQVARRGRPRPQLYVAMTVALVGMAALIWLGL
jgi:hypothetical protein